MEIGQILVKEIIKKIFERISLENDHEVQTPNAPQLEEHLTQIMNWAMQVQFYGMAEAEKTASCTVGLKMSLVPRRFRDSHPLTSFKTEEDLLCDSKNYILLGDPGSGKTTTIKRLVQKILLEPPEQDDDIWQYPLVLRLKSTRHSICRTLADELGIIYESKKITENTSDASPGGAFTQEIVNHFVGQQRLDRYLAKVLDSTDAILLLDGLDEVTPEWRDKFEEEIVLLSQSLQRSKIIVSCRSGDYNTEVEGFNKIEICPLEIEQLQSIATLWLDDNSGFFELLENLPYRDLANRPLFLCQLIVLYKNTGYLPERPIDVYRKITRLMLEEWDGTRKIRRLSKYGGFDPDKKIDFLASVAYHLTYKIKTQRFLEDDLNSIYKKIHKSFGLPAAEADKVAREIESHTGIVVQVGTKYEFSHLSLQEFLCAYYLIRDPFSDHLFVYLAEYPAPVAVAVALSADPSKWFSGVVLNGYDLRRLTERSARSFLARVIRERPLFTQSPYLGIAVIVILFISEETLLSLVKKLMKDDEVSKSVGIALGLCQITRPISEEFYTINLHKNMAADFRITIPKSGVVSDYTLREVAESCDSIVEESFIERTAYAHLMLKNRPSSSTPTPATSPSDPSPAPPPTAETGTDPASSSNDSANASTADDPPRSAPPPRPG